MVEPAVVDLVAVDVSDVTIEGAFTTVYRVHGAEDTRLTLGLVRVSYRWAMIQGWCDENPTVGITLRTLM
jgi:hypothetical protein